MDFSSYATRRRKWEHSSGGRGLRSWLGGVLTPFAQPFPVQLRHRSEQSSQLHSCKKGDESLLRADWSKYGLEVIVGDSLAEKLVVPIKNR